jgi:hypothetical protein
MVTVSPTDPFQPWKPGKDVLGTSPGFNLAEEVGQVIRPYIESSKKRILASLCAPSKAVPVVDTIIYNMKNGG